MRLINPKVGSIKLTSEIKVDELSSAIYIGSVDSICIAGLILNKYKRLFISIFTELMEVLGVLRSVTRILFLQGEY